MTWKKLLKEVDIEDGIKYVKDNEDYSIGLGSVEYFAVIEHTFKYNGEYEYNGMVAYYSGDLLQVKLVTILNRFNCRFCSFGQTLSRTRLDSTHEQGTNSHKQQLVEEMSREIKTLTQ